VLPTKSEPSTVTGFAQVAAKQLKAEITQEKQEQSLQADRPIDSEV